MSSQNPTHNVQKATLEKFIDAWGRWHADDFIGLWSDDFSFTTLPFSAGKPTRKRDKVEPRYRQLMEALTNYKLNVKYVVHDPERRKACVYATMRADAACGEWVNEQALFIAFDESGEKVVRIEEMNDNAFRKEWDPKYYEMMGFGQPPKVEGGVSS
ncbi:hypothetical protein E4U55_007907 [Claviceps digitariae]|nr:hypothetical protein E4U55_007907 [Claviceps digitariae]